MVNGTDNRLDPKYVPKYLLDRPDVQARKLVNEGRIYEIVPGRTYKVAGRNSIYVVTVSFETLVCSCEAGSASKLCSHAIAVGLYREIKKGKKP
jgi:hypothetical protein